MRAEIDPFTYTIDANFMNGQSNLHGVAPNIGDLIIASCETNGFAIVRNTFATEDFSGLQDDCRQAFADHEKSRWLRHYDTNEAQKITKTREGKTELSEESNRLIGGLATALYKAAQGSPRTRTEDDAIETVFVTRYDRRGRVAKHRDAVSGVMCDTSLEGRALMGFWRGWRRVADVVLEPNDTVVMPAATVGNKGRSRTPHDVRNITRPGEGSAGSGHRFSLIYGYGRTRQA